MAARHTAEWIPPEIRADEKRMTNPTRQPGILVVDDDATLGRVLSQGLSQQSMTTWWAASGQEAVRLYSEHLSHVDLVLLDVWMPGWDGPRALQSLQALNPQVECWFMSGVAAEESEPQLLTLGAKRFIRKPFHVHDIMAAIQHWMHGIPRPPVPCTGTV